MANDRLEGELVPLTPKLKRIFYPPLVFLHCLNEVSGHQYPNREPTYIPLTPEQGPEETFRAFVSKIALICCTDIGGDSVSACTILQLPDRIQYVFASNRRNNEDLQLVGSAIKSILVMFQNGAPGPERERVSMHSEVLLAVLALCEPRIICYLKALCKHLNNCIFLCSREGTERARSLLAWLRKLLAVAEATLTIRGAKRAVNMIAASAFISSIDQIQRSEAYAEIRNRVAAANTTLSSDCWYELCHTAGRLKSYDQAVRVFFRARGDWPELFEVFDIEFVPSSEAIESPLQTNYKTVQDIVRVMSSEQEVLRVYGEQAGRLEALGLNDRIEAVWNGKSLRQSASSTDSTVESESGAVNSLKSGRRKRFRPIVHAELLLHNWLENTEGGTGKTRFFNGYKFIGSSKPTCRLCSYFFEEYPTDVQVRSSHRTVYLAWRMPDLYRHQGQAGVNRRYHVMQGIRKRLCNDIANAMHDRVGGNRIHDSDTYSMQTHASAVVRPSGVRNGETATEGIIGGLHLLSVTTPQPERAAFPDTGHGRRDIERQSTSVAGNENKDDDGSGVIVFRGRKHR